jgi:hypothetical protein
MGMIFTKRKGLFLQSYVNRGHDFHYVEGPSAKFCEKVGFWTDCCVV